METEVSVGVPLVNALSPAQNCCKTTYFVEPITYLMSTSRLVPS